MPVIDSVSELTPERALIFRVVHIENVAWILDHGLHCKASDLQDPNHPEKTERYQAEALVHRHLPTERLNAIVCGTTDSKARVDELVQNRNSQVEVVSRKLWFF